jgi:IS605 OrfB family transposase
MTIVRESDASFVRERENGPIVLVLNILGPKVKGSRQARLKEGVNAGTGKPVRPWSGKTKLIIPVSCSKWHENKFFSGRASLRSSLIIRKGDRWFIAAQFEFCHKPVSPECFFGLDRGISNLISGAVVDNAGAVQSVMPVSGNAIGEAMNKADRKAREFQRRTGRSIKLHHRESHHLLHEITNGIVAEAKSRRAQLVMEDLSGFKKTIVTARPKFAGKGGWRRLLKKAQLGKIEEMLRYKLKAAGLPVPRLVPAGGTSKTCSSCGHSETNNRIEQAKFVCLSCEAQMHADLNAAVQIARRGAMKPKKGEKLHDLHKNMVSHLKMRDDGGLGPLLAGAGSGLVAGRATADTPNDLSRET